MDLYVNPHRDYQIIDSGGERKLEKICGILFDRPTPQAVWRPQNEKIWKSASSICVRKTDGGGYWEHCSPLPEDLIFRWQDLSFKLRFTAFGHCGIFFEQMAIWETLQGVIGHQLLNNARPKLLNLFGYTGAASIVMAALGAEVYHVDSARRILDWGEENQRINQKRIKGNIHWKCDDVSNHVRFCRKKGFHFDGILMDPPTWGTGVKKNDKWVFENNIAALFEVVAELLTQDAFLLVTTHTPGVQKSTLAALVSMALPEYQLCCGDLGIRHTSDSRVLASGVYALGTSWKHCM
jgi:23S rRNA (cytosine1962-C5)-methyltransferase